MEFTAYCAIWSHLDYFLQKGIMNTLYSWIPYYPSQCNPCLSCFNILFKVPTSKLIFQQLKRNGLSYTVKIECEYNDINKSTVYHAYMIKYSPAGIAHHWAK